LKYFNGRINESIIKVKNFLKNLIMYNKKKKEKQVHLPICWDCLTSNLERKYYWINIKSFENSVHRVVSCDVCAKKNDSEIHEDYPMPRIKKKIDTKGWVEGEPTAKGNKRYIFLNKEGKEVTLLAETGLKKEFKPKIK
jgi:hypothetical protein